VPVQVGPGVLILNIKDVDKLINENGLGGQFKSGWYGLRVKCNLHEYGFSNMSPMSSQEYCHRIPKKKMTTKIFGDTVSHDKGKPRPNYDLLKCSWNACPKLKEILK